MKAIRGEERSQASVQAEVQVPHDPADLRPTGLTVSLVENQVTLSWTAPQEDADSVTGYEILRRRPNRSESTLATLVADTESTATTYTDATANEAGVVYVYRVKALRGNETSRWSNFDKIELPSDYVPDQAPTPEPEATSDDQAPTGLTAALAQGGGVALSWAAPAEDADGVTGYEVLRAVGEEELTTLVVDTESAATAYTDATATTAGETYAYQVKAIRGEDRSQASGQARVQLPHDPVDLAPSGLTAILAEDGGVSLSWTAPAGDADSVTGYEVLRAVGEGELTTLVADTASTATAYTDATATATGAGETYAYLVKAIRDQVRSQSSNKVAVVTEQTSSEDSTEESTAGTVLWSATMTAGAATVDGEVRAGYTSPVGELGSITGDSFQFDGVDTEVQTLMLRAGDLSLVLSPLPDGDYVLQVGEDSFNSSDGTLNTDGTTRSWAAASLAWSEGQEVLVELRSTPSADDPEPESTPIPTPEPTPEPTVEPSVPTAAIDLSASPVAVGDLIIVTVRFAGLEAASYSSRTQPHFRVDVVGADGCEGDGMGSERYFWTVGEDPEVRTAGTSPGCPAGEYTAETRLFDAAGDLLSRATAAFAVNDPSAPSNLSAALVENLVTLSWEAPPEDAASVTGYEILRGQGEAEPTTLEEDTGTTATTYSDATALEAGAGYTYRVRAIRDGERSEPSQTARIGLPEDYVPTESTSATKVEAEGETFLHSKGLDPGQVPPGNIVIRADVNMPRLLVGNTGQSPNGNEKLRYNTTPKHGQAFTTGGSETAYSVTSVGISLGQIVDTATAGSELTATINEATTNADDDSIPGGVLCTLVDPDSYMADSTNTYTAPSTGCTLAASTEYYVVVERAGTNASNIRWIKTSDSAEDSGSAEGWSIADIRVGYQIGFQEWLPNSGQSMMIEIRGGAAVIPNISATGRPIVNGAPYVGGTLRANISGIEDENGLDSETFTYQWMLVDGGDETDIAGATERSYTLTPDDEGKQVRVKIEFTDNEDYSEGPLASDPSGVVKAARLTQVLIGNTGEDVDENLDVLNTVTTKFAQKFTTGTESGSYSVSSVGIGFGDLDDPATAASELTATINAATTNADDESIPGDVLCTLVDPATYVADRLNYFTAPASGCALAPGAMHFVVLERANNTTDTIEPLATDSDNEDSGGARGWSIGNGRHFFHSQLNGWYEVTVDVLIIEVNGPEPVLNIPATGRVEIAGLTRVGYTLTAHTSLISDANGVPGRFTYQWVRVDGGDETDIDDATDQTYTLADEDEGKTIKVKVEFFDHDSFAEGPLTSAATGVVRPYVLNSSATGAPAINGTAQVGVQLGVNTSAIVDANGLPSTFSYQWVRVDGGAEADIDRATEPRYIPGPADEGKMLRVRVEFIDDDGFEESLLSAPTVAVVAAPVTAASSKSLWTATLTVGARTGDSTTGYSADHSGTLSPAAFDDRTNIHGPTSATFTFVTDEQGNEVIKRLGPVTTTYTVRSVVLSGGDLTFRVSPILPDTAATWKLKVGTGFTGALSSTNRTDDTATGVSSLTWTGTGLSLTSGQTVAIELEIVNSLPSGTLTVDGTPEVGKRLSADVSGISDANGKPERALAYSYQWLADGTSLGSRATAQHYWPTQDDVDRHLSVSVSYEDEDGFQEGPIYGSETVAVQAAVGAAVDLVAEDDLQE